MVFFLAVAHAPADFSHQVRDEFYQALDLVKSLSINSRVSQELWKIVVGLKEIGPKLGLMSRESQFTTHDPHSSAAVAMAGLAGHAVDELAAYANGSTSGQQTSLAGHLTDFFEAAKGHSGAPISGAQGMEGSAPNAYVNAMDEKERYGTVYGGEGKLSRMFLDLF